MSGNTENQNGTKPLAIVTAGAVLPNLRRFAEAPDCPQDIEETPTTICNDVWAAAHREIERIEAAPRLLRLDTKARVEAMLGVVSYCYAKGLFDSEEIERRLWLDAAFLATFGDEIPSAQMIRSFRRDHRENILAIIGRALQQYRQRTPSPAPAGSPGSSQPPCESAREQAQQLLDMASIMDQLAED